VLPLCAALVLGCHGEVGPAGEGTLLTPVCDATDPAQVVESQRIMLLTSPQILNTVRLISPTLAQNVVDNAIFNVTTEFQARFPPAKFESRKSIPNSTELTAFDLLAQTVGNYVRDNFAAVTMCATATDDCAVNWLNRIARKVYRRALTTGEQERFTGATGLYHTLRSQLANGCQVTTTVEVATGNAIYGLFMTPQFLWRWELGNAQAASAAPPGLYLTDAELASNLSFFMNDNPPDDMLIEAAATGTLRTNLAAHVDRLLQTQEARTWLTTIMRIYFTLNQLPAVGIDADLFPIVAGGGVYGDMEQESKLFLNDVMWNGKVMDLITSRKTFLNSNLATMVYNVPMPANATPTNFVETTLPADQRSGILTNAGFITRAYRTTGVGVVPRGLAVKALFLCLETPPPPDSINGEGGPVDTQRKMLDMMTAREQVNARSTTPPCSACHPSFDPYGLVLDWYDVLGRFRTVDHLNQPIDGTTKLPADVGGATVHSAVELADELSKSTVFMNCMSKTLLQYGLTDTTVELPVPAKMQRGCAAAGVANAVQRSSKQSFTDMARAVALSPAFVLRKQVP
jgi:hypothetical protein